MGMGILISLFLFSWESYGNGRNCPVHNGNGNDAMGRRVAYFEPIPRFPPLSATIMVCWFYTIIYNKS